VGRNRVLFAHLCRIESQVVGDPVHLDLLRPAGLRSSMTALRPAGRLIGEDSNGLKSVIRQLVGGRLKDARVERARHPMATVGAAIQYGAVVHGGNGSVL